jgi:hypothetical protein
VLDYMHRRRKADGLVIPPNFEPTVQSTFQRHCDGMAAFKKSGEPASAALFWLPEGKGEGIWALNKEAALDWIWAQPETARLIREANRQKATEP